MIDELQDRPVLSAAQVVRWKKKQGLLVTEFAPRHVLLCFQSDVLQYACRTGRARRVSGLAGETFVLDRQKEVAIVRSPGPGAPAAVAILEELVALGATRFISIGSAGAIQPALRSGDLVVPDRALRDEGTSRHYLPAERWVSASQDLIGGLCDRLQSARQSARVGRTWTTDAPYREMRGQVEEHRREGIDTVEMEAAALFAAGQFLNVQVAAGLAVADRLDGPESDVCLDRARLATALRQLVAAALEVLGGVE